MEDIEIDDVVEKLTVRLLPIIKDLLGNAKITLAEQRQKQGDENDEFTVTNIKKEYPQASPYLVRKWCKQGILNCWTSGDNYNSKYIFRRGDFENVYYNYFQKRGSK